MEGFVDIHQHCVYGMDDGARTEEDMYAMLRKAAADGTTRITATPHVTPGVHPFDYERYLRHLEKGNAYCRNEGLPLTLYPGCEILYSQMTPRFLTGGGIPTLADTEYCLVEFSPDDPYEKIADAVEKLQVNGYTPIIAHVERYTCLMRHAKRTMRLHEQNDVLFQMNCSTVLSGYGFWANLTLDKLFKAEMIDIVSSDAHSVNTRCTHMTEANDILRKKWGRECAEELTGGRARRLLFDRR